MIKAGLHEDTITGYTVSLPAANVNFTTAFIQKQQIQAAPTSSHSEPDQH